MNQNTGTNCKFHVGSFYKSAKDCFGTFCLVNNEGRAVGILTMKNQEIEREIISDGFISERNFLVSEARKYMDSHK